MLEHFLLKKSASKQKGIITIEVMIGVLGAIGQHSMGQEEEISEAIGVITAILNSARTQLVQMEKS